MMSTTRGRAIVVPGRSERLLRGGHFVGPKFRFWPIAPYRSATARYSDQADLVPAKPLKPIRREVGIPHGVRDVLVAEVMLQGSSVVALIRELVPTLREINRESLDCTVDPISSTYSKLRRYRRASDSWIVPILLDLLWAPSDRSAEVLD